MIQMASGPGETPPVASSRAYLRNGLPALYQDGDFGMRFVGALEELLDPIVAVLDGLPYHFDPNFAPPDILNLLAAWLGVDLDETQTISQQREMVLRSAELARRRGTVKGMELALKLHFPEAPMRIEDNGGVIWHGNPGPGNKSSSSFVVYCDVPVEENNAGGDRPLHRAVQAGAQHVPAAGEGSKAEGRVMRTCQSCGKENPNDRDFCSCGEYLRWEPTGFVQAVTPEMAAEAAAQAAPPPPPEPTPAPPPPTPTARAQPAVPPPPPAPAGGNGHQSPSARPHATHPARAGAAHGELAAGDPARAAAGAARPAADRADARARRGPACLAGAAAERAGDDRPAPARR